MSGRRAALGQAKLVAAFKPRQDDRPVARDAKPPERLLAQLIGGEYRAVGSQCRPGENHMRGQTLKQMGIFAESIAVAVLDLAVRPRQLEDARCGAGLAILIGQRQCLGP